jgi:hypothetical protein
MMQALLNNGKECAGFKLGAVLCITVEACPSTMFHALAEEARGFTHSNGSLHLGIH